MDARAFVEALIDAVPEALDREAELEDPLPYIALGSARMWIEEHALRVDLIRRRRTVRNEEPLRRFWDFVERQLAAGDREVENLVAIECFEGVVWVEEVIEYLGPRTRELFRQARAGAGP
jgi:hypothetical protein